MKLHRLTASPEGLPLPATGAEKASPERGQGFFIMETLRGPGYPPPRPCAGRPQAFPARPHSNPSLAKRHKGGRKEELPEEDMVWHCRLVGRTPVAPAAAIGRKGGIRTRHP